MGKDLKGRELGVNIFQQKNGLYTGSYINLEGKRIVKRSKNLKTIKEWISNVNVLEKRNTDFNNITVNELAIIWLKEKESTVKYNTWKNYDVFYRNHIKQYLGKMQVTDVKQAHCQKLFLDNKEKLSKGSLKVVKQTLSSLFKYAVMQDIISESPIKNIIIIDDKDKFAEEATDIETNKLKVLTKEEQTTFLKGIKGTYYEAEFILLLNTGLRVGELCGLKWSDVDFEKRILKIRRTVYCKRGTPVSGTPKTKDGVRNIPLTDEAIKILREQKKKKILILKNNEYIFKTKNGNLFSEKYFYRWLKENLPKMGLEHFTPHTLRHKPKTLQKILGHSNVAITMDLYVHSTDDDKRSEMANVAEYLKLSAM